MLHKNNSDINWDEYYSEMYCFENVSGLNDDWIPTAGV